MFHQRETVILMLLMLLLNVVTWYTQNIGQTAFIYLVLLYNHTESLQYSLRYCRKSHISRREVKISSIKVGGANCQKC